VCEYAGEVLTEAEGDAPDRRAAKARGVMENKHSTVESTDRVPT